METKDTLSDEVMNGDRDFRYYSEKDVKKYIREAKEELKINICTEYPHCEIDCESCSEIDQIFLKHFGGKLTDGK